jgi:hypothetical protein
MIDTQSKTSEQNAEIQPAPPKRKHKNAINSLRRASARKVRDNSSAIAAKLLEKTLQAMCSAPNCSSPSSS